VSGTQELGLIHKYFFLVYRIPFLVVLTSTKFAFSIFQKIKMSRNVTEFILNFITFIFNAMIRISNERNSAAIRVMEEIQQQLELDLLIQPQIYLQVATFFSLRYTNFFRCFAISNCLCLARPPYSFHSKRTSFFF
jgi:hypothetical protein